MHTLKIIQNPIIFYDFYRFFIDFLSIFGWFFSIFYWFLEPKIYHEKSYSSHNFMIFIDFWRFFDDFYRPFIDPKKVKSQGAGFESNYKVNKSQKRQKIGVNFSLKNGVGCMTALINFSIFELFFIVLNLKHTSPLYWFLTNSVFVFFLLFHVFLLVL